ncbi:poly(A) polymerase [Streptomyces sp. WAC06614]|uniref:poly(A) polymerase n=1 Tax=Streptomyces sp. WAC06614 TaxID=2487416 RepID=UPI000F79050F|nr:poly(A) polymerase [Streptomyces sp. WAC06614]RSS79593.1 polynucleotide adenylyltransferase [Streptomyces sp. WAC06614]
MRTSEQLYHQVRWDPRFDPARFVLGVHQRGAEPARVPLPSFVPGGDVPWHRVLFVEADGERVWDRAAGVDRIDTSRAGRVRRPRLLRAPFFTARSPHAWDPVRGAWTAAPEEGAGAAPAGTPTGTSGARGTGVRLLTWNTLWDRYDGPLIATARRRPLLLAELAAADVDVIALQEVEPALLALLLAEPWVRQRYTVTSDARGRDVAESGLLVLSRLPVREAGAHGLGPHKAVTAVTVDTADGPLVVAATHLSSDHSPDGASRREAELARIAEGLAGVEGNLVLLGDFNDGRGGAAGPAAALGLLDAWSLVHGPSDTTATFDPGANPLAAVSSLTGRAARLDRILLRAGTDGAGGVHVAGAALRGNRAATPDGLFVSDHFGVEAEVRFAPTGTDAPRPGDGGTAQDAADGPVGPALPVTARTAVAWLPPEGLWPALQDVRRDLDPQYDRWPPHVNLLFGFVPEASFEQAVPLLARAAAEVAPFPVRLAGVDGFGHRTDATVWLDPAADGGEPWARLRQALVRRFPQCAERAGGRPGYTPHLTLGRTADPHRAVMACTARLAGAELSARVGELALLSRRGDEPMQVRATVALGTGEVRWLPQEPEPGPAAGGAEPLGAGTTPEEVVRRLTAALPGAVLEVVGSRRTGCALPGADLDLVAALPGRPEPAWSAGRVAAALPEAVGLREVVGARVPGLRCAVAGLTVDLALVATGELPPAEAVARRADLGAAAAVALSAVTDAEALRTAVAAHHPAFATLTRRVKAWARARGLDSAPHGGLPGLAWSILTARTVTDADASLTPDALLRHFFATWAAWDWRRPVALAAGGEEPGGGSGAGAAAVTVLTPSAPVRSCTTQVGPGFRDLLVAELYRAWELLEDPPAGQQADLVAAPPLHLRHAAWAVITVRARDERRLTATAGRVRGRVRALLALLEEAGFPDVHAWPRPLPTTGLTAAPTTGLVQRWAVGLGPVPPTPTALAAVAARWSADLPDVEVTWCEGGGVPTLR